MALRFAEDRSGVDWFEKGLLRINGQAVGTLVPAGYGAYARVLHPFWLPTEWDQTPVPVRWADVMRAGETIYDVEKAIVDGNSNRAPRRTDVWEPHAGQLSEIGTMVILPHLAAATKTSGDCWFGLWEGYGDLDVHSYAEGRSSHPHPGPCAFPEPIERMPPKLEIPARTCLLYRGSLEDVFGFRFHGSFLPPNVWWPADHAWALHSEIDAFWTIVAGSRVLIDALHADPSLEVLDAVFDQW